MVAMTRIVHTGLRMWPLTADTPRGCTTMPRTMLDRFEQRKLTRAKLVDAALQLFSTSGYDHATVDEISQEAGYSKGAYYFHFSTKDDILLELLRIWTEGRSAALVRD